MPEKVLKIVKWLSEWLKHDLSFIEAGMTWYQEKLDKIKATLYKNQGQIDRIIAIKRHIDNNYEHDLSLKKLSVEQFVSKFHLIRLFKKYYGITPRQYLMDKRIENAKMHLKCGKSVTETCYAVGFKSLGSFSILFKTRTGKSPASFQKEQFSRSKPITDFQSLTSIK
jgi:AraC-like DNA-binding protein